MVNENVLSQRYATKEMNDIFSERGKNLAERELWIAVLKAQKELGVPISSEDITKFERAKGDINLDYIKQIEKQTKHDIKAKIQGFIKVAGANEEIHKRMTSRDLTDNVEQMQIKNASEIIFSKYISIVRHFVDKSVNYSSLIITARTHHQAAQYTTLGRKMSMWLEELLRPVRQFEKFIENYPLRGIKGPVGTQADILDLLGSIEKVDVLEKKVADYLGFKNILSSPGQVYPRSLDAELTFNLVNLGFAIRNYALNMRLMAGYDLVTEGFAKNQTGSTAMPHKMNTRSSERICGFHDALKGYHNMALSLGGNQWEEGDVSCSVTRRVFIPDAFYSSEGMCETALTVLNGMGPYEAAINIENKKYAPFLGSTMVLGLAIDKGIGREVAHALIKKHSVAAAKAMKTKGTPPYISKALAEESAFKIAGITEADINSVFAKGDSLIGNAKRQIESVVESAGQLLKRYPKEAAYEPGDIL